MHILKTAINRHDLMFNKKIHFLDLPAESAVDVYLFQKIG